MHVVGIDGHKKTHTLVAVDPLGRRAGEVTVAATPAGHAQAIKWIVQFDQVLLAIEDCRHLTRRFEADLLLAGHAVVRAHTRLMAGARRSARERGKSDPIDAEAVARVALREPDLPRASLAGPARDVKLIADHRRRLVRNRTAAANKLRWFLHEIDPELPVPSRGLRRLCVFDALVAALANHEGVVAEIARDLVRECRRLTEQINALEARLRRLVESLAPSLLAIPGCGVISAAVIIGETAGAARFKSKDAFAHFTGTAPIPVWSSNKVRVRLNRGGNRFINHALHMIAVTQVRRGGEGADYFAKQLARGKTPKEAVRQRPADLRRPEGDGRRDRAEHLLRRRHPAALRTQPARCASHRGDPRDPRRELWRLRSPEGPRRLAQSRPEGGPLHGGTPDAPGRTAGVSRAKGPRTTRPAPEIARPKDLVNREFTATAPNQLWVADITYIRTFSGWVYAAFVIDVFSRTIVGWQVATSLYTELALDALDMAVWRRRREGADLAGLVHHSDRGVQYRALRYTERLDEAAAVASVGSKGDSYDNALAEAFNSLFKAELIRNKGPWTGINDVEIAVAEYIDWFNRRRLHGELGHVPPAEFEARHTPTATPELTLKTS